MSFIAILFALLIEQAKPLARGNFVHAMMRRWVRWSSRNFDAGQSHHASLAWLCAVAFPSLVVLGVHWALLLLIGWPAAVVWSMLVLYASLGFRQFSHHFTDIRDALEAGDEDQARELLAQWQQLEAKDLPRSEIVRHVIEYSVLAAHRHVFGVFTWFSVLAAFGLGPAGAVLYRMSEFVARYWRHNGRLGNQPVSDALQTTATKTWHLIDWLPARITALGFAVVGSFEEAIDAWRNHVQRQGDDNDGVILAATAGALNVALGAAVVDQDAPSRPAPEQAHLRSVVGLVWRSVVLWMVLLALLTLARLLG